ncbi:fumarylacetoacetate hydrolase family protein [Ferviditalea candida]|uniref:Fumarylacetoacetate hydrolase family protein n=1 Tax=Ferviditalea candida TaxID=3108399 RepID=A0ABU5ZN58_9BACL|nr:fumarylacetoacetate hydrolase family protein [Paenibacillaceae bacterium T2]
MVQENAVHPLEEVYDSLAELLQAGKEEVLAKANPSKALSLDVIKLASPITLPARIVCQGANYALHRAEAGMKSSRASFNLIFTKPDSSLSGAMDDIQLPSHVQLLDYEIELGLVMKTKIRRPVRVTEENLHEYVAGIIITNDVSARDVQLVEGQWFKGKSYRTFCPAGPFMYWLDPEEVSQIHHLDLKLWVNGELRQSANTEQLQYKPEETIEELSRMMDFDPGDLLLTGTPGGVALKLTGEQLSQLTNPFLPSDQKLTLLLESQAENKNYLKNGDIVRCEIKSPDGRIDLGFQENRVVSV